MSTLMFDGGAALKSLSREAAFTAGFVAILAVGLGVSTAIYAITNAILVKGFALVPNNEQLFYVTTSTSAMYYPDFEAWRTQARSIDGLVLVRNSPKLIDDGSGSPATYLATELTVDAFDLLGVHPAIGRSFVPSDGEPGASPVVLLRHEFWQSRFGMAADVVGRTIRLDGKVATVVGVMPSGFSFPTDQDLWAPLVPTEAAWERKTQFGRYAFGRLADGATLAMVREELGAISRRLSNEFPGTNQDLTPVVRTSSEWFVGDRAVLLFESMFGAAVVIVVMAWANVATLAIIRVIRKSGELATRLALGASHGRLVWSLVLENMVLSLAAGGIGWWIAKAIIAAYAAVQPPNTVSRVWDYTLDWPALVCLCALTLASGAAASLITATQLLSLNGNAALRSNARGATVGGRHRRLYQVLVSSAVAMTMVLLVAASALARSFLNVYNAEIGVDTANVISMSLYAQPERYPDAASRLAFYDEVSRRLEAIPGIKAVALANAAPGDDTRKMSFEIAGASAGTDAAKPVVGVMTVAAGYFQNLDARVSHGREFGITDTGRAEPVIVVNERFASRHWPRSSPIGEHVRLYSGSTPGPWLRVVGVVANIVQNDRTRQSFEPLVYLPHAQYPIPNLFALGRTSIAPEALVNAINKALHAVDSSLAVPGLWSLEERFNRIYGVERNVAILFVGFAIVALIVAGSGLYCTVSRAVSERSREIAIRCAIGAGSGDISRLVMRQALYPTGAGVAVGLAGSVGVHRLLASELVSVSAMDPISTASAAAALVAVAAIASAVPMLRAARIPPARVLTQD